MYVFKLGVKNFFIWDAFIFLFGNLIKYFQRLKWVISLTGFIFYLASTEFINSSGLNQIPKLGLHLACNDMALDGNP